MEGVTWCVAHTHPLKEGVAKQHLIHQGYQVYLPRFRKIRRHARKVEEVLMPLFPRYLFVGMDLERDRWRSVNSTRGVAYLLMHQDFVPARVPAHVIADLRAQEIGDEIVPLASLVTFVKGEKVRILEGAFQDHVATFEGWDAKNRVQLLLQLMGREIKVSFPWEAVEAASS